MTPRRLPNRCVTGSRMEAEDGLTAFWAMTEQPSIDSGAEPLVMISDVSRDGVVYLFSFVDIESAQTFLRDEEERGTHPDTCSSTGRCRLRGKSIAGGI